MKAALRAALARWAAVPAVVRWVPAAALMAALWWSSSRTPAPRPKDVVRDTLHNGAHVAAYAALAAAALLALRPRAAFRGRDVAIAFAVSAAYGVVDELHQRSVPGRVASVLDVVSDAAGALLACALLPWWLDASPRARRAAAWSAAAATALPW